MIPGAKAQTRRHQAAGCELPLHSIASLALTHWDPPPQSLSEPGKIAHCRELAERGLSDLNAYRGAGGGGEGSISLKGATH